MKVKRKKGKVKFTLSLEEASWLQDFIQNYYGEYGKEVGGEHRCNLFHKIQECLEVKEN